MDLKYIHDNEIHEKYILDQLDEEEKQAYVAFLKSHPEVQQELEETRKLIAGIKTAGKSYMRKEIEEQVAALRNPKTDWSVIYKAAAVLFVLVLLPAIFYYQSQFSNNQKITEQTPYQGSRVTDEAKSMEKAESAEAASDNSDDKMSQKEMVSGQPFEKQKNSPSQKKRTAGIGQNKDNTQSVAVTAAKNAASEPVEERESVIKEAADAGASERQRIKETPRTAAYPDVLQSESIDIESDLDQALGHVSSASTLKKTTSSDKAMQSAPSGIIGTDYLPPIRSLTYVNDNDSLLLHLNRTSLREPLPDFLKVSVMKDTLNFQEVNLYVSDPLHSLDRKDINVTWKKDNKIDIIFTGKATYEVSLDNNQKTARRIK